MIQPAAVAYMSAGIALAAAGAWYARGRYDSKITAEFAKLKAELLEGVRKAESTMKADVEHFDIGVATGVHKALTEVEAEAKKL